MAQRQITDPLHMSAYNLHRAATARYFALWNRWRAALKDPSTEPATLADLLGSLLTAHDEIRDALALRLDAEWRQRCRDAEGHEREDEW